MSQGPAERLGDILASIQSIADAEELMARAESSGDATTAQIALNSLLYDLVIIGEAVRSLPAGICDAEPAIPWRQIVGMRNRLAHEYFRPDHDLVALTIDEPLEALRTACLRLRANLP